MKTRGFIIGAFALGLVLVATGANAYVPTVSDFNFVNNIGTLTWTTSEGTINIDVTVTAPEGFGETYDAYKNPIFVGQYDTPGTSGTFPVENQHILPGTTFNACYGYYYKISVTGYTEESESLDSFGFNLGTAVLTEIGYNAGDDGVAPSGWGMDGSVLRIDWDEGILTNYSGADGESQEIYMASEYWWEWNNAVFDGDVQGPGDGGYNDTGMLPSPNPEAPTVALFMLGIFGLHVWRNKGLRFMANSR